MIQQQLEQFFKFTPSDLQANRGGQLSQKQREDIVQAAKKAKPVSIGCGCGFFLIASIFPIVFTPLAWESRDSIGAVIGIMIGVFAWAMVWGLIGAFMIRGAFKKPSFILKKAEGPINIVAVMRTSGGENPTTYRAHELHVGGESFDVDGNLADFLMQGDICAFYFLADDDRIMSVDWLGKLRQ